MATNDSTRATFSMSTRTLRALAISAAGIVLLAVYLGLDPLAWSNLRVFVRMGFDTLVPLAGLVAIVVSYFVVRARRGKDEKPDWDASAAERDRIMLANKTRVAKERATSLGLVGLFVVALAGSIWYWVLAGYGTDQQYLGQVKVVDAPAPTFEQRAAFPIAEASARTNLQDTVGELGPVRFVVDGDKQTWNSLVVSRATFGGYQAVEEQTIGLTGTTTSTNLCEFRTDIADRRIGGWFSHSLERAVFDQRRDVTFASGDAYGLCAGDKHDHPMVVMPLIKVVDFSHAYAMPAGVAVYDGWTGEVRIYDTVTAGQLPGPVYPMSLAARQREALAATGSFGDYWNGRAGFEGTDDSDNTTEFNLGRVKGGAAFVTPLTPRGGSASIVAQGIVDSSSMTAGQFNTLTVHKLAKARIANTTTVQRIRGDYGDLPEWAAKMEVFEITPVSSDVWVASLGQNQDVNYRVMVKADGSSCLERADGTKLRCGKVTGTAGFGPGVALADGATPSTTPAGTPATIPANADLSKLSDAQLVTLHEQVTREMLARMSK